VIGDVLAAGSTMAAGVERGHLVDQLAATHRVLHEMQAGPCPDHHPVGLAQASVRGQGRCRHRAAVGDVAGVDGFAVSDELVAGRRVRPVGADERVTHVLGAVGADDQCLARAGLDAVHVLRRHQLHQAAVLARLLDGAVQVGSMGDEVPVAEARDERLGSLQRRDPGAGHGVAQDETAGVERVAHHVVQHAEPLQHPRGVRPYLQTRPDLTELRSPLQHPHPVVPTGEREGRSETSDTSADDEELTGFGRSHGTPTGHDKGILGMRTMLLRYSRDVSGNAVVSITSRALIA
jgi:hypothetical protein